jgi:nitric oxide dioxygenase
MKPLSEDELDLVRSSFRELSLVSAEGAARFYDRLFALASRLRAMFPADMEQQGAKLMSMTGIVVAQLHELAVLRPLLDDLARRHRVYGARPEHYALVGEALLWTLERKLGAAFTPAHGAAWRRAYLALSEAMLDGAAV